MARLALGGLAEGARGVAPGDGGADTASDLGIDRFVDRSADVRPGDDDAACGLVRCVDRIVSGMNAVSSGAFGAMTKV